VLDVRSATFGIRTRDIGRARDWYARVLGRPPDIAPAPDVYEWRLAAAAWLQLTPRGDEEPGGAGAILRIGVADLDAARAALADAGGARLGDVERVAGVIAYCDVEDPFGNVLSLYAEPDGD
jgi:predicted enzyme related to lactoylglutathione lyase